ncbi:hypothetical protein IRZ59_22115 [Pseudomonas guariconensis]|uniref:hypothetical protein n=1 Tax=Pseudomonas guariconensis TaxID=1288410 RepID=UPI0018AB9A01|nr:hypothetical protein [Pseudomonas guariconensis]MBF8733130.1 hypothetical protein [Pseudomonas guariconensis]
MQKSGYLCLAFMIAVGFPSFFLDREMMTASLLAIAAFSFGYFVFYLIRHKLYHGMLQGILLSLLVIAFSFVPVLGWIVLIGFVLYNIAKALEGLKVLVPDVLVSALIYGLLTARVAFDVRDLLAISVLAMIYLCVCVQYCRRLQGLGTELALFKMSIMWLSIPFVVLTIVSIVSALGNLFRTVSSTFTRTILTPQTVSAHMRAGVQVAEYTRHVQSSVTQTVTQVLPGAGATIAGASGGLAGDVKQAKGKV